MNKVRKVILIFLVFCILCLLFIIFYNVVFLPNVEKKKNEKDNETSIIEFEYEKYKYITYCKDENNCPLGEQTYANLSVNGVHGKLKQVIEEINSDILQSYELSQSSSIEGAECSSVTDLYNYSLAFFNYAEIYEDENIITIAYMKSGKNLCTNISLASEFISYYYDVSTNTFFDEEEFKSRYDINDDDIISAISARIEENNAELNTTNSYDAEKGYHVFLNYDGNIEVFYNMIGNPVGDTLFLDISIK